MKHTKHVSGVHLPECLVTDTQPVEDELSLGQMFAVQASLAFLEIVQRRRSDRVLIPVKLLNLIPDRQFDKSADELGAGEVAVIF